MFGTIEDLNKVFKMQDIYKKRLNNIEAKLKLEPNNQFWIDLKANLTQLVNGTAKPIEEIKSILHVIEWKAELIKYDLIDNGNDVFVQWKWREVSNW